MLSTPPAFVLSQDQTLRECLRDNPANTSRERNQEEKQPLSVHSVLAVMCFKGTSPQTNRPGNGVSTYLALTFGTLLSSQGTDASFETLTGPSGRFPSMFPTLSDPYRTRIPVGGAYRCLSGLLAVPTFQTLAGLSEDS